MDSMLSKAPRYTPPLGLLIESLGQPLPRTVADALGVAERTVFHWIAKGAAPRPAALALFWASPYGRALIDADREHLVDNLRGLSDALKAENTALRAQIGRVLALNDHGAANAPSWRYEVTPGPFPVPPAAAEHPPRHAR